MGHDHSHSHDSSQNIKMAFVLNLAFTIIEIAGGLWTHSLAIVSDAVHDLGDSLALGMAWGLERVSKKKRDAVFSYGYRRFSLLGALFNTLVLLGGSVFVLSRAVPRILQPEPTNAPGMIALALVGMLANGLAVLRLKGQRSANARTVMLHLMEDVLGWVAVFIVSIFLLFTDWYILDPLLSIFITFWVLANVVRHIRKTLRLFLQGVPDDISVDALRADLEALEGVWEVHHLHIWSMDGDHHVLTAHVVVNRDCSREEIVTLKSSINTLTSALHFVHTTLEFEYSDEACHNTADCA